jgi:hypothetical protein
VSKTEINLAGMICSKCGIVFGLTESFAQVAEESGKRFHCPNGCRIGLQARSKESLIVRKHLREARREIVALKERVAELALRAERAEAMRPDAEGGAV